jgi:hypothetical protein
MSSTLPERVTVDSDFVIAAAASLNAASSLVYRLGGDALSDVGEWLYDAADMLVRSAFNQVGVIREDDDPVVLALDSRTKGCEATILSLFREAIAS